VLNNVDLEGQKFEANKLFRHNNHSNLEYCAKGFNFSKMIGNLGRQLKICRDKENNSKLAFNEIK